MVVLGEEKGLLAPKCFSESHIRVQSVAKCFLLQEDLCKLFFWPKSLLKCIKMDASWV